MCVFNAEFCTIIYSERREGAKVLSDIHSGRFQKRKTGQKKKPEELCAIPRCPKPRYAECGHPRDFGTPPIRNLHPDSFLVEIPPYICKK